MHTTEFAASENLKRFIKLRTSHCCGLLKKKPKDIRKNVIQYMQQVIECFSCFANKVINFQRDSRSGSVK